VQLQVQDVLKAFVQVITDHRRAQMGRLTQQLGKKPRQFVIVPWPYDEELWGDARDFWEKAGIYRSKAKELAEDCGKEPQNTVLYVLAHSGQGVSFIGTSGSERMSAGQLVRYLVDNGLPSQILAVKIWACFTGVNGFAQEVKAKFLAEQKGYNPIVVGYNHGTGGPLSEAADDKHKYVYAVGAGGGRGALIGRGSAHQTIF
jgi:hypothetical protein